MKKHSDRLIVSTLRHHGPLSDAQLVWWLNLIGMKAGTVTKKRRRLTEQKIVRRSEEPELNSRGQLVNRWELAPRFRFRQPALK
jgi:hypothetical protein